MTEFFNNKHLKQIVVFESHTLPKLSSFRTVRGLERGEEVYTCFPVFTDCLKHLGIFRGDVLVVKITKHFNEANLYVWNSPTGNLARFGEMNCAKIILHNGNGTRETFFRAEVEC